MADVYQISSTTTNTVNDIGDRALNVAISGYSGALIDKINSALANNISGNTVNDMDLVPVIDGGVLKAITPENLAIALDEMVVGTAVVAKYNVISTSDSTQLCYSGSVSQFSAMKIDGVAQPSVVSAYTFSTTGEHTVKYTLADSTSIRNDTFYLCYRLTSVTIPNSVTSIGNKAFFSCSSLTSISIPNSVTSIGDDVFYLCSKLTSVTIPNSVTSIGARAFMGCSKLISVTIGSGVTSIGYGAFMFCSSLTSISVGSGNSRYDSRNNCNAIIETRTNTLIVGCKNTVIPNSVTSIGDEAFYDCFGLTSITIPDSVTSIGESAFEDCSDLIEIICNAYYAPTLSTSVFSNAGTGGTLIVPYGSTDYDVWMLNEDGYLGYLGWTMEEE